MTSREIHRALRAGVVIAVLLIGICVYLGVAVFGPKFVEFIQVAR